MKIFQICVEGNAGSTGRIAEAIGNLLIDSGFESYIAHTRFRRPSSSKIITISNSFDVFQHGLLTRFFDRHCLGSKYSTIRLIKKIKKINPDIIHLHHLHGYYINIEVLFEFLSSASIPVVWTFHDCWSFTGHCAYFDYVACDKWQTGCHHCPQKREYPSSFFIDRSRKNYLLKKKLFTSVPKMTIVPVSLWLQNIVFHSFMRQIPIRTIYNGVDISLFKPQSNGVAVRNKYGIGNRFMLLGVANPWTRRKGFIDFLELSKLLDADSVIVLVGLSSSQVKLLPSNIWGFTKTENQQDLIDLYSAADLFVNPTWEDNFPTTNIESLACGTPLVTYRTGGSVEAVTPETGFVVDKGNVPSLFEVCQIVKKNGKNGYVDACRNRAVDFYSKEDRFTEYLDLYMSLLKEKK